MKKYALYVVFLAVSQGALTQFAAAAETAKDMPEDVAISCAFDAVAKTLINKEAKTELEHKKFALLWKNAHEGPASYTAGPRVSGLNVGVDGIAIPQQPSGAAQATPAAQSPSSSGRALPSPLPSPPFPDSDWLGFPIIGQPYSPPPATPLENAISGSRWTSKGYYLYGWLNPSWNYSTSRNSNQPLSYDLVPNKVELDQAVLMAEKWPDTVQTKHDDWGFRSVNLYGTNYRYTIMDGIFSNQLLKRNQLYGVDPVEAYGIYYTPKVAQGMVVRVGRYISPPDIEAQLTPDNYMYSHSLMFTVDPYTFMGVNAMIRLNQQWSLMLQADGGNDMALWSRASSPNFGIMARYVTKDGNDGLWGGINSIGAGKVKDFHDDLQQIVETWGHRFNAKYHMQTEAYYMWEYDAPLGGTQIFGPNQQFASGMGPGPIIPGRSEAEGLVNYFQILEGKNDFMSIRTDFLNDPEGYRTGFKNLYFSETLGWTHFFSPMTTIRPEIRWETGDRNPAYDNGTRKTQFEIALDLIQRF